MSRPDSRPERRAESRAESRTGRTRPARVPVVAGAVVGAVIGAVALAGCGAGQVTQTSEQVAAVEGSSATVGAIAVRNARFEFDTAADTAAIYEAGANAPLEMSIVNTAAEADRLVAASSPVASAVEIVGDATVPGGQALVIEGAPAAAPATSTEPAAGGTRSASVVLTGLREDLQAGPTYPVVLTFERAGDVRIDVPVGNSDTPRVDEH